MDHTKKRPKVALARQLRKTMTEPEVILWFRLKTRADGLVFKRQKAYGPYILDFYCFAARLVVEVDGAIHWEDDVMARDKVKDAYLASQGLHVHRIPAEDIYDDADEVAKSVWLLAEALALKRKQESPPPRA
jgi:very-short-patch-repair endonuclease